jgi:anion-transporting  ArsA/GET3 family ATPase
MMIVNSLPEDLLAGRLLLVSGKGGVGKSTLAAALALRAAVDKPVRLVELGAETLPRMFGVPAACAGQLAPGVEWQRLSLERALETYGMIKLRLRLVYNAVFEHRLVRKFLQAMPVLADLMMLGHLAYLVEQRPDALVVVDGRATGSMRQMLEAPRAVLETAPPGPLREAAGWIQQVLFESGRSRLVLVVTPEELPVNEAVELYHVFRDQLNLAASLAAANRVWGEAFESEREQHCRAALQEAGAVHLERAFALVQARLRIQQRHLERLQAGVPAPLLLLPEVVGASGPRLIQELAQALAAPGAFPRRVVS